MTDLRGETAAQIRVDAALLGVPDDRMQRIAFTAATAAQAIESALEGTTTSDLYDQFTQFRDDPELLAWCAAMLARNTASALADSLGHAEAVEVIRQVRLGRMDTAGLDLA